MTVLGAFVWCSVLTWFGARITAAHPDLMNDPEALVRMVKQEGQWIVIAVLVLCALYILVMRLTSRSAAPPAPGHRGLIAGPAHQAGGKQSGHLRCSRSWSAQAPMPGRSSGVCRMVHRYSGTRPNVFLGGHPANGIEAAQVDGPRSSCAASFSRFRL